MNNITFGQYYPIDSLIHRLDSRIKILITMLFIVMVFVANSFYAYSVIAFYVVIVVVLSKIPFINVLKSIKIILFLLMFTAVLNIFFYGEGEIIVSFWVLKITKDGILFAAKMAIRLIMLVVGTSLLTLTTTPMQLTDGIESLMAPLKLVRLPVHDFAIIMSITLRFIPSLMEETDKIMKAQKSRGATFDEGGLIKRAKSLLPILIPLFVSAFRRADELALALDARCYNASPHRTKMKVFKILFIDVISLLLVILLSVYIFLLKYSVFPSFY